MKFDPTKSELKEALGISVERRAEIAEQLATTLSTIPEDVQIDIRQMTEIISRMDLAPEELYTLGIAMGHAYNNP